MTKFLTASVLGVAMLAACQQATAQYSTTFDNLTRDETLSDQDGWLTNDEYTGSTYNPTPTDPNQVRSIGQADDVTTVTGFGTSGTDQLAVFGGAVNQPFGAVPGQPTVYLYHPTNLPAASLGLQLSTDFQLTPSSTARDTFGFNFQNAQLANVFGINFSPATSVAQDNVTYSIGATTNTVTATTPTATLNQRYHLVVNANLTPVGGTFSAYIVPENATGGENGARINVASNVPFTGTIADVAAAWVLASNTTTPATGTVPTDVPASGNTNNKAYTGAGTNSLYFDNFSITVPEPSTDAWLAAGLLGVVAAARRRGRRA